MARSWWSETMDDSRASSPRATSLPWWPTRTPGRRIVRCQLMSRDPETTAMDSSLAEVIHRLTVSDLRYLPILDKEGHPVSILAARDLVDFLSARIEN